MRGQQGMAMLVALVVLAVVSILGVTAMQMALFQNRVSANAQVAQHLFQGAESGLQGIAQLMVDGLADGEHPLADPASALARAWSGDVLRVCIDGDGVPAADDEAAMVGSERFEVTACDPRGPLRLQVSGVLAPPPPDLPAALPIEGYDIGGAYVLQQVYARSWSSIDGVRAQASHVQLWGVRGVNPE